MGDDGQISAGAGLKDELAEEILLRGLLELLAQQPRSVAQLQSQSRRIDDDLLVTPSSGKYRLLAGSISALSVSEVPDQDGAGVGVAGVDRGSDGAGTVAHDDGCTGSLNHRRLRQGGVAKHFDLVLKAWVVNPEELIEVPRDGERPAVASLGGVNIEECVLVVAEVPHPHMRILLEAVTERTDPPSSPPSRSPSRPAVVAEPRTS
jgi:hypothetical protein